MISAILPFLLILALATTTITTKVLQNQNKSVVFQTDRAFFKTFSIKKLECLQKGATLKQGRAAISSPEDIVPAPLPQDDCLGNRRETP